MLEPAKDYLARRAEELGLDRADDLDRVQQVLDTWYPGQARAKLLHRGVLRVITPSSAVAQDLRLRQIEFLGACNIKQVRLAISIQAL
jgi:hypothetical protein